VPSHPLTAAGLFERARALGVGVVQVCDNLPLAGPVEPVYRLEVELGTRGCAPEHLLTQLELCRAMGSSLLRVVLDDGPEPVTETQVCERLAAVLPAFEGAGVTVAIENHDLHPAAFYVRLMEHFRSPRLGICLDTANSLGALEGPRAVVDALGPWVANLHVKDFVIERVPTMLGFTLEGRPAGQGMLDVPWVLTELGRAGARGNAIVELWTPPADETSATIAREREWAEESVRYLRTLIPD